MPRYLISVDKEIERPENKEAENMATGAYA